MIRPEQLPRPTAPKPDTRAIAAAEAHIDGALQAAVADLRPGESFRETMFPVPPRWSVDLLAEVEARYRDGGWRLTRYHSEGKLYFIIAPRRAFGLL